MSEQERVNLGALSDLCTPWCIHVVATLRIADQIAAGATEIDDLAAAAGCDSDALHRVLTHLVGKGVFQEPSFGRFVLNEAARGLLDPAQRLVRRAVVNGDAKPGAGEMPGHWMTHDAQTEKRDLRHVRLQNPVLIREDGMYHRAV